MIPLISIGQTTEPVWRGMLELDLDPLADRVYIADRKDMDLIHHSQAVENMTIIVPAIYNTVNDLVVIIFDDAGTPLYNMTGNDKVSVPLVNLRA